MKGPTPAQRFLGVPDGAESPFDLLGLTPDSCDDAAIEQGLLARLERVSRHPEGASAEADEVRLALHAAAAQLADPRVRTLIASRWKRPRSLLSRATPAGEVSRRTAFLSRAESTFRSLALPLLARRSESRARRLLLALARSHGLSIATVLRLTVQSAPQPRAPIAEPRLSLAEQLKADLENEGARLKRRYAAPLIIAGSSLGVILLLVAVLVAPSWRDTPLQDETLPDAPAEPPPVAEFAPPPPPEPAPPELDIAPAEILATLRELPIRLRTDPGEAAWKYEQTIRALSLGWTDIDGPTLAACLDAMVEFLHRAPSGGETESRALRAVGAGAAVLESSGPALESRAVKPAVWSVGALSRLAQERELPMRTRDEIRSSLVRLAPTALEEHAAPFHAGAAAALRVVANVAPVPSGDVTSGGDDLWGLWLESLEAWRRTGEQLAGTPGSLTEPRDELLLAAVRRLLVLGPAPSTWLGAQKLLERILGSLDWRAAGARARIRLFEWFDDPAVSTRDLATVTEWIAQASYAPGVTPALILSRAASSDQRRELRDRLRAALGEPHPTDDRAAPAPDAAAARVALDEWTAIVRDRLAQKDSPGALAPIERSCSLSRLNAAASLVWRGDHESARSLLRSLTQPIADARSSVPPPRWAETPVLKGGPGDGMWAREWISAPASIERRLEILASLESRAGELGPADADMLAEAALSAPQHELRDRARRIVRAHARETVVVNGLLEALPAAPRLEETADLIADVTASNLPAADNPSWPAEARAALVLRLMGMLLLESELGASDRLAGVIAASHAISAGGPPDAAQSVDPETGAARLWEHWLGELRRVEQASAGSGADAVSQRRDARLALAQDPVRRFCANQLSAMEAMADVTSAERPSAARAIVEVVERAASDRRSATSITQQLESTERAMIELWRIRFGVTPEARP